MCSCNEFTKIMLLAQVFHLFQVEWPAYGQAHIGQFYLGEIGQEEEGDDNNKE